MKEELKKIEVREVLGQVFETNTLYNTCPCGEIIEQGCLGSMVDKYFVRDVAIGICDCGNIFLTKFNYKKREVSKK